MAPGETENNNAYAKFWGDKQRALWYVKVFSGVVNLFTHGTLRSSRNSLNVSMRPRLNRNFEVLVFELN